LTKPNLNQTGAFSMKAQYQKLIKELGENEEGD
jgi:hypothetical protein